jgi:hypothetical protein
VAEVPSTLSWPPTSSNVPRELPPRKLRLTERDTDDSEELGNSSDLIARDEAAKQAADVAAAGASVFLAATAPGAFGGAASSSSAPGCACGRTPAEQPGLPPLSAHIVSTVNQLEEEPWLPVRSIVTLFRIQVHFGEQQWELLKRYSDFYELDLQLTKSFDPTLLPPLPPKLMVNEDAAIASRFLELDAYVKGLLASDIVARNPKVHEFLGVEKHGARYGVRRYECASRHAARELAPRRACPAARAHATTPPPTPSSSLQVRLDPERRQPVHS